MTEAKVQEEWLQDYATRIANHIAQYRKYLKISGEELSRLTEEVGYKIPRSSIANIENHKKKTITSHELSIISAALGVPPEGLIWNIFKPAETFSYTPTSNKLPGYMVFSEVIKNELLPTKKTRLAEILNKLSFVNMVYTQALEKQYAARTYYRTAAANAERFGHSKLAQTINSSADFKEVTSAAQFESLAERLSDLRNFGVEIWEPNQHMFWTNGADADLHIMFSSYLLESNTQENVRGTAAADLMRQFGIQPVHKLELISADQIPNTPSYEITELDKVRYFPNYHGE